MIRGSECDTELCNPFCNKYNIKAKYAYFMLVSVLTVAKQFYTA